MKKVLAVVAVLLIVALTIGCNKTKQASQIDDSNSTVESTALVPEETVTETSPQLDVQEEGTKADKFEKNTEDIEQPENTEYTDSTKSLEETTQVTTYPTPLPAEDNWETPDL